MAVETPGRRSEIEYVNPEAPDTSLPAYRGKSYEALVPDTLELQDMAALAVNGLTEPTDPEADYEIYWRAAFSTNPPVMWHSESDCVQVKFMEALPLMRLASGSRRNLQVEQRWMEVIRQMQGHDGLLYLPKRGRPWCVFGEYGKEPPGDHYFAPWQQGRLLNAMTLYHQLTGDARWREAGNALVEGVDGLVVHDGDKAHFACHEFGTEGRYHLPANPADPVHNPAAYQNWAIQGLANFGRHTGNERAIVLAGKLSRWVREDSGHFDLDARFLEEYPGTGHVHFHGHTAGLLAALDYGLAAGDEEAIDFARRGFEYGMSQGECQLGYFAEWLNVARPTTLELCEVADMIALAVKLSRAGAGDYWDMVERWTRNLFFEAQLRPALVQRLHWISERGATTEIAPVTLPPYHTADRAIERNVGAFGGHLAPNDWLPDFPHHNPCHAPGIAHCCTGNGTRAIYYVWENALTHSNGTLRVNLLMNRASHWADVDSHIPYTGRVDINIKQPVDLSIRLPEWAKPEETQCGVNGEKRELSFAGRYAQVGNVQPRDSVALTFPLAKRADCIHVEKRTYRVLLRGNTCVAVDPPGANCPLFQREHLRQDETRWRTTTRFVAEQTVDW